MKSDRLVTRACVTLASDTPVNGPVRYSRSSAARFRRTLNPTRLSVERLCERVLLSAVPYASEPALVQQVSRPDDCSLGGDFVFKSEAIARCFAGTISGEGDAVIKDFQVTGTGRLIVEMLAAESALDSMLWLYDENGQTLLVNNDDRGPGQLSSRISQRLTQGTYRIEMTASPAASGVAASGGFEIGMRWQPTAELSVASVRVEGGAEGAVVRDLDADGIEDIASVNDDDQLIVYYGVGDGSFRGKEVVGEISGAAGRRIVAGNFDGVGRLDLVIAQEIDKQLVLVTHDGGKWTIHPERFQLDGEPDDLAVGDLNHDGLDDLVVPTRSTGSQYVFYGSQSKPLDTYSKSSFLGADETKFENARSSVVGHFNDDNLLDVAIAHKGTESVVRVWLNRGSVASADGEPKNGQPDNGKPKVVRFELSDTVKMGPGNLPDSGTEGLVAADFDNDGILDLASVNDKSDTVSIRLGRGDFGRGDGTFFPQSKDDEFELEFQVGTDSERLRAADFNHDGIPDVVVTNEDTHNVSVLIAIAGPDGKGTGRFHPRVLYACGFRPVDIQIGDFNQDKNPDLAVKLDGGGMTLIFGLGDGTFLVPEGTALGDDPEAVAAADFNADGFLDVAVANLLSHEVSILLGRGDGGFAPQIRYELPGGKYPHAIAIGDINDDGRPDIVTANEGTDNVSILLGLGNGQFRPLASPTAVGDSPWAVVIADFDDDDLLDIATANRKSNDVTILYGKRGADVAFDRENYDIGAGRLPEELLVEKDRHANVVALATINRLTRDFTVFAFTPGTRGAGEAVTKASQPFGKELNLASLPAWMQYDGAQPRPLDANRNEDTSPIRFMPRAVTTADFNNDRRADVVMVDDRTHSAWILLGHVDGTFTPPIQFPVHINPEYVVAKDLDNDGYIDLVTAHDRDSKVGVHFGRGDGTFEDAELLDSEGGPERVIVDYFTQDRRLDIAIANDDSKSIDFWKQDADRKLVKVVNLKEVGGKQVEVSPVSSPATVSPTNATTSGHFTDDTIRDLASFDRQTGEVQIFAGSGDGKFAWVNSVRLTSQDTKAFPKAEFIVSADLDGNGRDDIVVPDMTSNRVWILWNDGNGQFKVESRDFTQEATAKATERAELEPMTINDTAGAADLDIRPAAIADFNGDQYLDIAVVNKFNNSVSVLFGKGPSNRRGTFQVTAAALLPVGVHPGTLAAGDFNNDGVDDLIVGNRGSYDLSILVSNGDGTFAPETRIGRTAGSAPSVSADFNRDGYEDCITTREIENDLTIELGRGGDADCDGNADFARATNGVHGAVVNPIVFDLNGDDHDDVISLNYRGEILVRYRETAPGDAPSLIRYAPPVIVNPGNPARDIALVQTADGWRIAAAELRDNLDEPRSSAGRVALYQRRNDGTFGRTVLATAAGAANIAAGDLNGDSYDEIVVYSTFTREARVFRQGQSGEFEPVGQPIAIGASVADIAIENIAGGPASREDLVVTSRASSTILVFVGNGDATLSTAPQIAARAGDETHWPYGYDASAGAVTSVHDTAASFVGLIDGDDSPDLLTINRATNSAVILLGKDRHTLSAPRSVALDGSPASATIGKVNNDEVADLVVLYTDGRAVVMLGDGLGGFAPQEPTAVGRDATGLRLMHADKDGFIDLAVSNRFGDVLTLLGDKDGMFHEFRRADLSVFLVVEDVDNDGVADYLFTNESRDRIEVRNSSSADFTQNAQHGLLAPGKIVVADFNRDGVRDLAVPNYGGNTVVVYLGVSPGVFAEGLAFAVGGNPSQASQADVNGDGIVDLVVANSGSNDVVVLYGQGRAETWSFDPGPRFAAGEGPIHTAVADANADGVPDIVVTNERDDSVTVLPGRAGGSFDDRPGSTTTLSVGVRPVQSFAFAGGLATLNSSSNSISYFRTINSAARTIPTFGSRPVSAVIGDFDFDRRVELIVAHELDGLFAIFSADADGFTLLRSQQFAGLSHPTDLAVWNDRGRISVFGVGDGREAAVLLFSAVPDTAFDLARVSRDVVDTEFVSFGERFLPFIVGLISGTEIGTFGALVYEGGDVASLVDDLVSVESAGRGMTYDKLPEEWLPGLEEEEDDGVPSAGETNGINELPAKAIPSNLTDEELRETSMRHDRDDFFAYFGGPANEQHNKAAADTSTVDPVPVGEANVGDGAAPASHEAQPGNLREDTPPRGDVESKPGRLSEETSDRPDFSRFRQQRLMLDREKNSWEPVGYHHGQSHQRNSPAAAIVFASFSFGRLPIKRPRSEATRSARPARNSSIREKA